MRSPAIRRCLPGLPPGWCRMGRRCAAARVARLDYEGELAVVIGRAARHVAVGEALAHVAGYSIFNDGSVRDYQMRTPQWTMGKNFDGTGGFGPCFVSADALPPGAAGLRLQTRVNGMVVQDTLTSDLIFDVATLVSLLSQGFTLHPGDLIMTGTPSGWAGCASRSCS